MIKKYYFNGKKSLLENLLFKKIEKTNLIVFSGGESNKILIDLFAKKKFFNKKILLSDERINVKTEYTNLTKLKKNFQISRFNNIIKFTKVSKSLIYLKTKIAFLGFAEDGHFASFFFDKQKDKIYNDYYKYVKQIGNVFPDRLNLNLSILLKMDEIFFLKKDNNFNSKKKYFKLFENKNFQFLTKNFKKQIYLIIY